MTDSTERLQAWEDNSARVGIAINLSSPSLKLFVEDSSLAGSSFCGPQLNLESALGFVAERWWLLACRSSRPRSRTSEISTQDRNHRDANLWSTRFVIDESNDSLIECSIKQPWGFGNHNEEMAPLFRTTYLAIHRPFRIKSQRRTSSTRPHLCGCPYNEVWES